MSFPDVQGRKGQYVDEEKYTKAHKGSLPIIVPALGIETVVVFIIDIITVLVTVLVDDGVVNCNGDNN